MPSFALVTQSEGKLMEFERILHQKLELCWLDLPEIQAIDVEEVVTYKVNRPTKHGGSLS
jgi:inosine/xanthosine triphosphate pyrophosphatase family protein